LRTQSLPDSFRIVIEMPDANDTLINLSFSMHSGPGTFALLLGSGISQGAEIPTGWEIVRDLIRQLATLEGEPDIDNPEQWFEEKYHEAPKYSFLIERVAPSPTDRQNLLKQYIEPTDSQREQGSKVPSQSHKSIAQLVKNGTVRIILTTNIDRLLETALGEVGITPVVIFNDDSLKGAMPYVHSPCTIIKLHGDYLDSRIKNTPDELAKYSDKMNTCLDRIFDEFGLVICGWSAKWDLALRDALYRRQNRRFSSYWVYPQKLSSEASDLKDHLRAIPLPIENADKFFQKLSENIEALQAFERPHPLSVPLAIAQVKKFVAEDKYRVQLHDLVQDEVNKLCEELNSDRFKTEGLGITDDNFKIEFQKRIQEYENSAAMAIGIFSTLTYFDNSKVAPLISGNIMRLARRPRNGGHFVDLQLYPALLVSYTIGIAAIETQNYRALAALLLDTKCDDYGRKRSIPKCLNVWDVFSQRSYKLIPIENAENLHTPASDYLLKTLCKPLSHIIHDKQRYEESFNIFEYILGLVCVDLETPDLSSARIWGPAGRFGWCYNLEYKFSKIPTPIDEFFRKGIAQGSNWGLLKAGFFNGSIDRLNECKSVYDTFLESVVSKWH
jgi:hypothetical protein